MDVQRVSFKDPEASAKFTDSFLHTGFAVVTDHPISHQLIQDVLKDWQQFYASDAKNKYTIKSAEQSGYFPFRSENAKGYVQKDLKEFYHLHHGSPLPQELNPRSLELFQSLQKLAATLLGWIEKNTPAKVSAKFSMPLEKMIEDSRETLLRTIHYPPIVGGEEDGAIRAAAHEDINLITLLPAATAPGLEVLDLKGKWHAVECNPGDIVVNAGDMLQEASGGYYHSTTHRVVNPSGPAAKLPRYSMPLFLHARAEVKLSERLTAAQYLEQRHKELGLKK